MFSYMFLTTRLSPPWSSYHLTDNRSVRSCGRCVPCRRSRSWFSPFPSFNRPMMSSNRSGSHAIKLSLYLKSSTHSPSTNMHRSRNTNSSWWKRLRWYCSFLWNEVGVILCVCRKAKGREVVHQNAGIKWSISIGTTVRLPECALTSRIPSLQFRPESIWGDVLNRN